MVGCPRCATRFNSDSPVCPLCGAGPVASFQEDSDAPAEQTTPNLTPRINTDQIRSQLSQKALICGLISGIGLCLLIASYAALFGEGIWFGCAILVFVAPCAGLLGALGFSIFAESLQILIRPLLHALDPRARKALRRIKGELESTASGLNLVRGNNLFLSKEDRVADDIPFQTGDRDAAFNPQIQQPSDATDSDGAPR
jgi:hypothetical protein